jgi:hypothetical protein
VLTLLWFESSRIFHVTWTSGTTPADRFESGYSLHTLRQASGRSWKIGQRQPVRVFYLHYEETMQSSCLSLMGRKLLVSLAMESKFSREGMQSLDEDDDMPTARARELVTENGVGDRRWLEPLIQAIFVP